MTKKQQSAADILAELAADPVYLARRAKKEALQLERQLEINRLSAPILESLNEQGFAGASIQAIGEQYSPLPASAVEILLTALAAIDHDRLQESMVRILASPAAPFDGSALKECYERTHDEGLKWAVLNTIAIVRPHSIDDWLLAIKDTSAGETLRRLSGQSNG